ncbi:MAG: bifunctional heptose 7-phosphate kinase/heptose 1-phosphate adenyltransferase, partial [Sulfurifustis sp.]
MNIDLARLADAFRGLRVSIFGDPLLDVYLEGRCERLCREAPIPVVQVDVVRDVPGGAANVAANAAALGAHVRLIGLIGDDAEGARLRAALERHDVPVADIVAAPRRRTVAKHRLVEDGQILARFDHGAPDAAPPLSDALVCERVRRALDESDVVIVSDYGYGTVSTAALSVLAQRPKRSRVQLVADGHDLKRLAPLQPTAVKPSYDEIARLLGHHAPSAGGRVEWVGAHAEAILQTTAARIAAVTLDRDGALVLERARAPYRTYARPARASRATGGGDTFVAALALAIAAGADTPEA